MEGIDIPQFVEAYGLPGIVIIVQAFIIRSLWADNKELNKEVREALREVFPAMVALQSAMDFIKGSSK